MGLGQIPLHREVLPSTADMLMMKVLTGSSARAWPKILNKIATESCHLIFWYSMKYHAQTLRVLRTEHGLRHRSLPLIWMKTDNVGIYLILNVDPEEFTKPFSRTTWWIGRLFKLVANAYGAPTIRERHMSEKPESVVRHFFRMVVDETSIVLDPTCGSGSAIRAAESLKAKHVLDLEINPEFAATARRALRTARELRKAGSSMARARPRRASMLCHGHQRSGKWDYP